MVFVLPSKRDFVNLGGERLFFFALSASMLMGKLPAALEGALGMGLGCRMLLGWGSPQPLLPWTLGEVWGAQGRLGAGPGNWRRSVGFEEVPGAQGRPLMRGGSQGFCGVPNLFPRDPPFAGSQIPFCMGTEWIRN